jgi:hypothetical protein
MMQSDSIDQLAAALAAAQIELVPVARDSTVSTGTYTYAYASLAVVLEAVRPVLSRHGLAIIQIVVPRAEPITSEHVDFRRSRDGSLIELRRPAQSLGSVRTMLAHTSGQWVASELPILAPWGDVQAIGAAVTYYRRISLKAIVGLAEVDDTDGEPATDSVQSRSLPQMDVATPKADGKTDTATHTDPRVVAQEMAQTNSVAPTPAPTPECPSDLRRYWKDRGLLPELKEFVKEMELHGRASQWSDEQRRLVHEGMLRAYPDGALTYSTSDIPF